MIDARPQAPPAKQQGLPAQDVIRINRLRKVFAPGTAGELVALDDINCAIREGDFVSIVGPSGCGKSTLLRILAGLLDYSDGAVTMDDQPVQGTRRDVGVVFQSSILLPWRTVLDNVMLPAEVLGLDIAAAARRRARPAARWCGSTVSRTGCPVNSPEACSSGPRSRGRLLHDPRILLMDEPVGALDAMTREQMNMELQRIWAEKPQDHRAHHPFDPEAVFLGDVVLVMTARPGTLERIIPVDLPRPRTMASMSTPEFGARTQEIRALFNHAGAFD